MEASRAILFVWQREVEFDALVVLGLILFCLAVRASASCVESFRLHFFVQRSRFEFAYGKLRASFYLFGGAGFIFGLFWCSVALELSNSVFLVWRWELEFRMWGVSGFFNAFSGFEKIAIQFEIRHKLSCFLSFWNSFNIHSARADVV